MNRLRLCGCVALLVLVGACKKQPAGESGGDRGKSVADKAVPALFANVPADTPYLMAAIEAVPVEYYAKIKNIFEPMFGHVTKAWRGEQNKLLDAIVDELDGKWSQVGLESLGLSAEPRFAVYGLGLQPAIMRLEVKDHKVLRSTIERIAAKAGEQLAPMKTRAGRDYWTIALPDSVTLVVALADNLLIAALGEASQIDAKLGVILGEDKPAHNMADGKLVKELMTRHGIGPYLVGFADTRRIADAAIELAMGTPPPPACTAEIARVSAKVPRVVLGYSELSLSKVTGGLIVELAPETAAALRAVKTSVPGVAEASAREPVMAIGGGVDLAKGQQLLVAAAGHFKQIGTACAIESMASGSEAISSALARPLPEPLAEITGGVVEVQDVVFGQSPNAPPEKVEAVVMIASPDAKALFAKLTKLSPELADLGVTPDGKLHDIPAGKLPLPYPAAAAIGDKAIVIAVGDKRAALADKLLGAAGTRDTPLLAVSYNYGKLLGFMGVMQQSAGASEDDKLVADLLAIVTRAFGQLHGSLDVTPAGLAMWSTLELK